jgi:hypothetical protein
MLELRSLLTVLRWRGRAWLRRLRAGRLRLLVIVPFVIVFLLRIKLRKYNRRVCGGCHACCHNKRS